MLEIPENLIKYIANQINVASRRFTLHMLNVIQLDVSI